ncbi:hypothetical protein OS189_16020 [Sulfitobacter sp. F26169L]|uniref:NYN domain-containing protein n=1 Tax=Sulfitobacter sp. F26169L TaxID=2996015 RepID=UPI0022609481|nr:hypothetical protein [Sulfitobacter sp. F26169L]MCX7567852.1 hypothetical protein [Sulfitobacter sp. F26169L]
MSVRILVDGSNVLYWRGGQADVAAPEMVVAALTARRFSPVIYFDNSIRLYADQATLNRLETLAPVIIAPGGTQADALLLGDCGQGRIQIVSNDRFRTWRAEHPRLRGDWLVTGSIAKRGRVCFSKKLRPAPL